MFYSEWGNINIEPNKPERQCHHEFSQLWESEVGAEVGQEVWRAPRREAGAGSGSEASKWVYLVMSSTLNHGFLCLTFC